MKNLISEINRVMPLSTSSQKRTGNKNSRYVGNPIQYMRIDKRLRDVLTREQYMVGFAFELIGNNGHDGSIVKNAENIDIK